VRLRVNGTSTCRPVCGSLRLPYLTPLLRLCLPSARLDCLGARA
jgi:hypothetical protein